MSVAIGAPSFRHGSKGSIGTTEVQLTATSSVVKRGVTVKAAVGNSGKVYVGLTGVTADTVAATDGFELSAGDSVTVEVDDPSKVYVIGSASGQKVFWVGV